MAKKILVIGSSNTDMVLTVPHIPVKGESILGGAFRIAAGGKGANQAVAAARAGGEVTFVARVGNDSFGATSLKNLKQDGIDISWISRDPNVPSGVALIFVDKRGGNAIAVASGANAELTPGDIERAESIFKTHDIVLAQLESPLCTVSRVAELACQYGKTFILNPAPARKLPASLLSRVDILTPNETEAGILSGMEVTNQKSASRAARKLTNMGVRTVIITMGAAGAFLSDGHNEEMIPGFKVKALDTVAAGDAFNGGLAVALGERKPIQDAIRFAHAVASISVTRHGAQPSLPRREEVLAVLKKSVSSHCDH